MKKITASIFALALLPIVPMMGCKKQIAGTATQALAPGYTSQADQDIGVALAAARGYYLKIQQDIAAGTYKPSAAEKQAYNSFGLTLNTAQLAYLAYHNGTGTLQAAQQATDQVTAAQKAMETVKP